MPADPPTHVVIEPLAAQRMLAGTMRSGRVEVVDGGDLARVTADPGDDVQVVHANRFEDVVPGDGLVCVVVDGEIRCYAPDPVDLTVLPERADIFDRVRGVFETDVLRDRSVAVLGLGSGGSVILRELARCGVGRFLLVDHDRLEIGNVSRHECGLSDVGRLKTNAARDLVLDRNPAAEIAAMTLKIDGDTIDELAAAIETFDVDLVVCATDNRASRLLVNRLCVLAGLPALYAGVFRRAYGGQVLRYVPGLSPCYQCFVSALPMMATDQEISSETVASAIAYSDRIVAVEPGLAADIAPVALLVAKLALQEVLGDTASTLASLNEDLVAPLYLWLNRREANTEYATLAPLATGVDQMSVLRWYGIGLARAVDCPACGDFAADLDTSAFALRK
ncbi:ThiF family adenylyltransferase [Lentzea nigeriaca]|uniref:ThiF family adenylyltransferase n=1 Tax=Lentzea nigeriaca TaxID=1128665 RepID=UPI0019582E84|nr:ThiF family adenylyltransferase [Lentzea nigeriaca]MBM7863648.1 molybdopterin/thiamine biosynthesis adenylyltransferase [Lentzea nigeriaca]